MEGLLFYLDKFQTMISLWDESSSFMGSFGRYTGDGGASVGYDRSIYLELANVPNDFRRDLKQSRCRIQYPRLNLCLLGFKRKFLGHPAQFIDAMKNEKSSQDDGLIQRFLLCAPNPIFLSAQEINQAPDLICALDNILLFIHHANANMPNIYSLDLDAAAKFNTYFTDFRQIVKNSYHIDCFIR